MLNILLQLAVLGIFHVNLLLKNTYELYKKNVY